jgi:arsenate reductase (thioredoxin)
MKHALFLCTHNSARSILAEGLLRHLAGDRWIAHSAGSAPSGRVNPAALEALQAIGADTTGLRSKSWDEFSAAGAPEMDLVVTVCDNAAGEVCPLWLGHPLTVHWGFADPSAARGDAATVRAAFAHTRELIAERLRAFLALPFDALGRDELQVQLQRLGAR